MNGSCLKNETAKPLLYRLSLYIIRFVLKIKDFFIFFSFFVPKAGKPDDTPLSGPFPRISAGADASDRFLRYPGICLQTGILRASGPGPAHCREWWATGFCCVWTMKESKQAILWYKDEADV
jgi:hypothetical protein